MKKLFSPDEDLSHDDFIKIKTQVVGLLEEFSK